MFDITTGRAATRAAAIAFAMLAAACSGGETDQGQTSPPPPPPPPAGPSATVEAAIVAERTLGSPGSDFLLDANVVIADGDVETLEWTLPDGMVLFGDQVTVSFPDQGEHEVRLDVIVKGEALASASITLFTLSPDDPTPDYLGLPDVYADPDGDGALSLDDLLIAAQVSGGLRQVGDAAEIRALDLDFVDAVTSADARLFALALAQDARLPTSLLDSQGAPGFVATLVSDALLDSIDADVTVEVDGIESPSVDQLTLGYLNFMIPPEIASGPRVVDVRLLINGAETARFDFELLETRARSADPGAEIAEGLEALASALEDLGADQRAAFITNGGEPEAADTLVSLYDALAEEYRGLERELREILNEAAGEANSDLDLLLQLMNANGFDDFESPAQSAASLAPSAIRTQNSADPNYVCDVLLPDLCAIQQAAENVEDGFKGASAFCRLLGVRGASGSGSAEIGSQGAPLVIGAVAARVLAWARKGCKASKNARRIGKTTADLVDDLSFRLDAEPRRLTGAAGEDLSFTTLVRVGGVGDSCEATRSAQEALLAILGVSAALEVELRGAAATPSGEPTTVFGFDLSELIRNLGEASLALISDVNAALSSANDSANAICSLSSQALPYPADRVFTQPPATAGLLSFNGENATYTCPTPGPNVDLTYLLEGGAPICSVRQDVFVQMVCETVQVTVTWGDNGSANDDIFELRVPELGFVRTTSEPVRSTSATLELAAGDYTLLLIGRAAPDGIGTYFINVSGADVIGGDARSGRDLVPGAVKEFQIRVQ